MRSRTKIRLSKLASSVVFQLCRVFSVCGHLPFLSFFEAEVFPDLVLLFLLSSACQCLRIIKEMILFLFEAVPCRHTTKSIEFL